MRSGAPCNGYDSGAPHDAMHGSPPISTFHHWLLAETNGRSSPLAIVIHGDASTDLPSLVREVADHLNEYDDQAEGRWLAATDDLIARIAGDSANRRLLGLPDPHPHDGPQIPETVDALERHGHVVVPGHREPRNRSRPGSFHASIGSATDEPCHLHLDPVLLGDTPLARVIGDVFLEWAHHEPQRCRA